MADLRVHGARAWADWCHHAGFADCSLHDPCRILLFTLVRASAQLILSHPRLGPPVIAWRERGAISLFAKRISSVSMLGAWLLSLFLGLAPTILAIQAAAMIGAAAFIWSRPSA